jgi:phosphoenolpyruvate carboxykinase (GTP)
VGGAEETPIGYLPAKAALDRRGLDVSDEALAELLAVDRDGWRANLQGQGEFFAKFGDRLPAGIRHERDRLARRLRAR